MCGEALKAGAVGMDEVDVDDVQAFPAAFGVGQMLSRSEEKAIHLPSGDQEGRKSPPEPEVRGEAL